MWRRHAIPGCILVTWFLVGHDVPAQQASHPGAVEEISPQLDVGYAMRPRVGLYGITELMMAALEANLQKVKHLVEQGADIEETDDTGGTPLMWAVQGGDIEIVNYLLDSGADVGAVGGRNATAFMIAVISGKEEIGVRLLAAGATFSGELSHQQDYLEYAAAHGRATLVQALIRHGADLGESGADALCFASRNRHFEAVRVLIDAGADVNRRGNLSNELPLIHALQAKDLALVKLLVESGAEINRKDRMDRVSIMYYATQTGQPSIVSYLLDNGATLGKEEADQLLRSAVYKGSTEMADMFVARGATISLTHLFDAVSNKQFEMANAFAAAIGIETMDDYTLDRLVDHANSRGHLEMVDDLLDAIGRRNDRGHLRLLFETAGADRCNLRTWDPQAPAATATVLEEFSCDAALFTSRRRSSLFVLQGDRIGVHSIDNEFPAFSLEVPAPEIDARLDEIRHQFAQRYAGNYDWVSAEIVTIGYLENGEIALVTHTGGPADGTYASQFAWNGATWTLVETQSCHRFDGICHVPGVDGQSIDRWPMRRAVWHAALQRNPGFVEWTAQPNVAVFEFNGRRTELAYTLSGSDHCAEECTFTDSVTIRPAGANPIHLVPANSRVSIAERFILVRPARQNSRLYDLGTGEDILGEIGRATWVH